MVLLDRHGTAKKPRHTSSKHIEAKVRVLLLFQHVQQVTAATHLELTCVSSHSCRDTTTGNPINGYTIEWADQPLTDKWVWAADPVT